MASSFLTTESDVLIPLRVQHKVECFRGKLESVVTYLLLVDLELALPFCYLTLSMLAQLG